MSSKNVSNKKCSHKMAFFNEKKIEKDQEGADFETTSFMDGPLHQFLESNNFLWVC